MEPLPAFAFLTMSDHELDDPLKNNYVVHIVSGTIMCLKHISPQNPLLSILLHYSFQNINIYGFVEEYAITTIVSYDDDLIPIFETCAEWYRDYRNWADRKQLEA